MYLFTFWCFGETKVTGLSSHCSHHWQWGGTDHLKRVMEMDLCCGNWYKLDQTGLMNSLCVSHSHALRHH